MKHLFTLCLFFISLTVFGQTASFTTIPVAVNGSINVCAGSTILFNSTVNPATLIAPAVYSWDFGNGQTAAIPGPVGINYASPGTYTVTYNITHANGSLTQNTVTVNVSAAPAVVPTFSTAGGNNCEQLSTVNGIPVIQTVGNTCNCNQYTGPMISLNNANSQPPGTTATIYWGANGLGGTSSTFPIGTANLLNTPFNFPGQQNNNAPTTHYNTPGSYNLMYLVNYPNGCTYSTYVIMSYGAAGISLGPLSAQTQCNPLIYNLTFANQTPGNTYVINWGDGTPNTSFTYPNLPLLPNGVPHQYAPSSCANGVPQPYTITITATNPCQGSTTTSTIGPFYVSQLPNASFTPSIGTCICQNQSITFTNTSTGGLSINNGQCSNAYNFGWTINFSNALNGAGYQVTAGSMGDPFNSPAVNGSNQITVQFSQAGTYTLSMDAVNSACGNNTDSLVITVNNCQNPNSLNVCPTPNNQSICSGASTVPVNWNSNQPNTTTTWTLSANPNIVGAVSSGTGTVPSMVLNNTSNTPQNIVYTASSTANGFTVSNTHTITVNPTPSMTALNPLISVCPNATITPSTFISTLNGTVFSWSNSNNSIGLGSSGTGQIAPWTPPANNTINAITGIVTVTPTYNGCVGTANSFTVTINPTPTVTNNTLTQSICSGVNTSSVFWTSNVAGTTYSWTGVGSSPTVTGFTASGSGNLPAMTIINSSNSVQTVTYTVTPTTNGCSGPGITYTIIVNPTPQLTLYPNQVICSGTTTLITSHINSVAGGGFTYSLFNAAGIPPSIIGYPVSGSGQIPAATITNMGMNPYTLNYTVTPTANGCSGTSSLYTITVYPAPAILFSTVNQTICSGQNTNVVNISSPTQGVTINWSLQGAIPAGIGNVNVISGTNFIPTYQNVINSTNAPITIGFTAFAVSQGPIQCPGSPGTYLITINPLPSVFAGNNQTVCNGSQATLTASGATTYLWNNGVQNGVPFTPNATQTYIVTGTNANGCQNYDTVVVTVNNPSSSTIDSVACAPFLLNGQTYNQSGTYTQTIPNSQGCDSSITLNLTINDLPTTPTITVDSNNVLSISGQANCTYQWVFCSTGFAIAGEIDTLFIPTTNGVYAVQATNVCGTSTSQCVTINNVSLSELGSMISVFPNPTFSEITVMSDQLSHEEYTIHDQMGRDVSSGFLQGSTTLIDFGNLSKGIYILKIQGISTPIAVVKE